MKEKYSNLIKKIKVNGTEWEYIVEGAGKETFLIIPGGGQTAQSNFKLIEELKKDYKVITVTLYSCDSINQFNDAINKILEKENATNLIVYGLSIGGLLAQSYLLRNKEKIKNIIISHACTPKSKTYFRKIIIPLKLLSIFLPLIPNSLIRLIAKHFSTMVQGGTKYHYKSVFNEVELKQNEQLRNEFYNKYLNKRLLKTWINLHMDFYKHEDITAEKFRDWKGKVLILRTDNDPLMQDEGDFKKVYPKAKVYTFKDTGHLSFYYQFDELVKNIQTFIMG